MKRGYRFFAAVFAFALVFAAGWMLAAPAARAEIVYSGTYEKDGDNLTWTLDDQGLLTISGTGEIRDYFMSGRSDVKEVVIESGVTSIGVHAFQNCSKDCVINCEIDAKPEGWESSWNPTPCQVVWNYTR